MSTLFIPGPVSPEVQARRVEEVRRLWDEFEARLDQITEDRHGKSS